MRGLSLCRSKKNESNKNVMIHFKTMRLSEILTNDTDTTLWLFSLFPLGLRLSL